jgi:molybdopterin-guanine dinucleotide biosynthesis protein A
MREQIEAGRLKITSFLGAVAVCYVREEELRRFDPELRSFSNTNTEEDLEAVRRVLTAGG